MPVEQGFTTVSRVNGIACGSRPDGGECWGEYAAEFDPGVELDHELLEMYGGFSGCGYRDGVASCWGQSGDYGINIEMEDAAKLLAVGTKIVCLLGRDGQFECQSATEDGAFMAELPRYATDLSSWELGACSTGDAGLQCVGLMPGPAVVQPPIGAMATRVAMDPAGGTSGCVIVDTEIQCWGHPDPESGPEPAGEFKLIEYGAGGRTTCAVTLDDEIECFGSTAGWTVWP